MHSNKIIICKYYLKNKCKFRKKCKFRHLSVNKMNDILKKYEELKREKTSLGIRRKM